MSSSADAASDVASEAPTQVADAKKKKSKKKTTIGVTSAALVDGAAAAAALHPAVAKDPLYDVGKVARVGVGGRRPSAMASAGSPLDLALALQAYAPPATQGLFDRS